MVSTDITIPPELDRTNRPTLPEIADDINARVRNVDDERLNIAIRLAEAKDLCAEQGVPFKHWVEANIEFVKYREASKLAKIGADDNPAKALTDQRAKSNEASKKSQAKRKSSNQTTAPSAPDQPRLSRKEGIARQIRDGIIALTGLPSPGEAVTFFDGTDDQTLVGEHLAEAADWLTKFAEEWQNA